MAQTGNKRGGRAKPKGRTALVMKRKDPTKHWKEARGKLAGTDRLFKRKYTTAQELADYKTWAVERFGKKRGTKMADDAKKMHAADKAKKKETTTAKKK